MKLRQFSIRDLLWLTLVVALLTAFGLKIWRQAYEIQNLKLQVINTDSQLTETKLKAQRLEIKWELSQQKVKALEQKNGAEPLAK